MKTRDINLEQAGWQATIVLLGAFMTTTLLGGCYIDGYWRDKQAEHLGTPVLSPMWNAGESDVSREMRRRSQKDD